MYIISLSPLRHTPFPPLSPSLISLTVSVDVKHNVYLFAGRSARTSYSRLPPSSTFSPSPISLMASVDVKYPVYLLPVIIVRITVLLKGSALDRA